MGYLIYPSEKLEKSRPFHWLIACIRLKLKLLDAPSIRAQETAQPLTECLKADFRTLPELVEVNFGRWEGLPFKQVKVADPDLINYWADLKEGFCFHEGGSHLGFKLEN